MYYHSPPGLQEGLECKASSSRPGQGTVSDCPGAATPVLYTAGEASLSCAGVILALDKDSATEEQGRSGRIHHA
jgi:hypothetical protein